MNDTLSSEYYSESPNSGLFAYWRFDETAGDTTFDLTSNHNDGLINGATFVLSDALFASGIYFYTWQIGNDFVETKKMLLIR